MAHQQALATAARSGPSRLEDRPQRQLADTVSATSLSFVACGAAVADLGELLRDLRLELRVPAPRAASPAADRAAALLAFRLQAVRGVLDEATTAVNSLREDCGTGADRECTEREPPRVNRLPSFGDNRRAALRPTGFPRPEVSFDSRH